MSDGVTEPIALLRAVFSLGLAAASIAVAFKTGRLLGKLEGIDEANKERKRVMDKQNRRMREPTRVRT